MTTREAWREFLARGLDAEVEVHFTQARRSVLRVVRKRGAYVVRMQAFFEHAPAEVRQAVLTWMRLGQRAPQATRLVDAWIDARLAELWRAQPVELALQTRGRVHDLAPMARELLATELACDFPPGAPFPPITWGRAGRSRTRHSLRLGSYDFHSTVVRIHPVLDQEAVPGWFVRYVLFHELLHAALPASRSPDTRRVIHSAAFRERERRYPDTARALSWEKAHIRSLIVSARTGKPLAPQPMRSDRPRIRRPKVAAKRSWIQRLLFETC